MIRTYLKGGLESFVIKREGVERTRGEEESIGQKDTGRSEVNLFNLISPKLIFDTITVKSESCSALCFSDGSLCV